MIQAFLESVKYASYMIPVAFLRIYFGWLYFNTALERTNSDFLVQPRLAAQIKEWLPYTVAPDWYRNWLENVVTPNWELFSYTLVYCEFLIGLSLIAGFLVRPISVVAALFALQMIWGIGAPSVQLHQIHLVVFITFMWLGAGRCFGFDYFFYKRQRGLWW